MYLIARTVEVARSGGYSMGGQSWLSEGHYRSLFENSVLGIYRTTPDGRILAANPTLVSMLGFTSFEELAQRNLDAMAWPLGNRRAEFKERIERDGEVRGFEAAWPRRDGTPLFVRENARAIRLPGGPILYYEGTVEDVSERKRIEEAEARQRLFAEALCETAAALSGTLDFDEVLDRILDQAGRVLAHDGARIMLLDGDLVHIVRGHGARELGLEKANAQLLLHWRKVRNLCQVVETGRPLAISETRDFPGWVWIPNLDWIRSNATVPIHSQGRVIGFLGLDSVTPNFYKQEDAERLQAFADQAGLAIENARLYEQIRRHAADLQQEATRLEQRVAERTAALSEAMRQLTELDRMKSQFVSNVSHELRTPLANIKLYLSLLRHGKPQKQEQYMGTLEREADLLQRLIENLLDLSRLDLGTAQPDLAPVDLNQLVGALAGDRAALLANHGLALQAELASGLPRVQADAHMLTQVLTNLMTNAMNYSTPGGGIAIGTTAEANDGGSWVGFYVRDTGPGIPAEEQAHLFERFYRGDAARRSRMPGTGLGLSICEEIVRRHHGKITLASQVGGGSTFTVWLPVAK